MGETTAIEWADSSINLAMGCGGCELSSRKGSGTCYAEILTTRYAGSSKGYPSDFYSPKLFLERLAQALRWKDLTGTERTGKPWLSGLPRHIFNGDMGDYWTEELPLDWIHPHIPAMAASPHIWIFLTKRPSRMRRSFEIYGSVTRNFLLMTSITSRVTLRRIAELRRIPCVRGLSVEPLLEDLGDADLSGIAWTICGGESGPKARPFRPAWARSLRERTEEGSAFFMKQFGSYPIIDPRYDQSLPGSTRRFRDKKGGDPEEWPMDLRVRQMPGLST